MTIETARAEKAVEYLRDSAEKYGKARGTRPSARPISGVSKRSRCSPEEPTTSPLGKQEARAYASDDLYASRHGFTECDSRCGNLRAKREAADMTIEVWRSQASAAKQGLSSLMRHITGKPTKAQQARFEKLTEMGCICCALDGFKVWPIEVHHLLSGNKRRGHLQTIPLCRWHHRGIKPYPYVVSVEAPPPPSLAHGSKPFHAHYGDDDKLLAEVNRRIA